MGVFDDKKFEELDWISQATEPIDSQLNEMLSELPEVFDIDFDTYIEIIDDNYSLSCSVRAILKHLFLHNSRIYNDLTYHQASALEKCFEIRSTNEDLILDCETRKIVGGSIQLIKIKTTMDEDVLKHILGREGVDYVAQSGYGDECIPRYKEIMEIIGKCDDGIRTRSVYKKRKILTMRVAAMFKTNEWNIRDTELANKVGFWIKSYISDGNLSALSNLCRLKVMTHKGQPIYSMEEIQ